MSLEHKKRVLSAVIGVALIFGLYYFLGHYGIILITVFISAASYSEFLSFSGATRTSKWISVAAGVALCSWLSLALPGALMAIYLAALAVLMRGFWRVHTSPPEALPGEFAFTQARVFGLVYLVVFPSFLPKVHSLPHGPWLILFLLCIIWMGDIAAYYGGKWLGQHKLSPNISPGKTLEGSAFGLVGCALLPIVFHRFALGHLPLSTLIFIAVSCSVVAQVGDLLESLMKRAFSVKDSGALIPGHGGVFDRFDSLILAAPFFYFLMRILG